MRPTHAKQSGFAAGRSKSSGKSVSKPKKDLPFDGGKPIKKSKVVDLVPVGDDTYGIDDDIAQFKGAFASSLEDDGATESRFTKQFQALKKQVGYENDHFNAEHTGEELTRAILEMVVDLIPVAEATYRTSKKEQAAYALNALINQVRDLNADLRMSKNVEQQADFIRMRIIDPVLKSFATALLAEIMSSKTHVDTVLAESPKRARSIKLNLDNALRSLGKHLTESTAKMTADIDSYLSGNMESLLPKKPKVSRGR